MRKNLCRRIDRERVVNRQVRGKADRKEGRQTRKKEGRKVRGKVGR